MALLKFPRVIEFEVGARYRIRPAIV